MTCLDVPCLVPGEVRHFRGHPVRITYCHGERLLNVDDLKVALRCDTEEEAVAAMQALPEQDRRTLASIATGLSPWLLA
jgi:hypothetical protein